MEDPLFLRLTIAHYRALLATKLGDSARTNLGRLLRQAEEDLAALGPTSLGIPPARPRRRTPEQRRVG